MSTSKSKHGPRFGQSPYNVRKHPGADPYPGLAEDDPQRQQC